MTAPGSGATLPGSPVNLGFQYFDDDDLREITHGYVRARSLEQIGRTADSRRDYEAAEALGYDPGPHYFPEHYQDREWSGPSTRHLHLDS